MVVCCDDSATGSSTRPESFPVEASKTAEYKHAYDAVEEEFDLARTLIEARTVAGLSQAQWRAA